jgi:hypothetical protein
MAKGPRGQVRVENSTYRKLVAAMQPRFHKMFQEVVENRHSVMAVYSTALQPVRDSMDDLRRIIDAERITAARYGYNRISGIVGDRRSREFFDPAGKTDSSSATRMFLERVRRDLARELYFDQDETLGGSLDRISRRIARVLDSELARLSRINAAYGESFGAFRKLDELRVPAKMWWTMEDERVRHSHVTLHNQVVGLYDYFENGLLYPGDVMHGSPRDWMNCRCYLLPAERS